MNRNIFYIIGVIVVIVIVVNLLGCSKKSALLVIGHGREHLVTHIATAESVSLCVPMKS